MNLENKNIYTYIKGPGKNAPTLMLIPGVGCGAFVFDRFLPQLVRHFNVIAINLPWVDGADYPQLTTPPTITRLARVMHQVLDELEVEEVMVLGHSMGGFVAQRMALQEPERITHLVLVSTSQGGVQTDHDIARTLKDIANPHQVSEAHILVRRMFSKHFTHHHPEKVKALLETFHGRHSREDVVRLHLLCGACFSSVGELGFLDMPTLVIHGNDDALVDPDGADTMAAALPHSRLWRLDGGHMIFWEKPRVIDRVADFLLGDGTVGEKAPHASGPSPTTLASDQMWRLARAHMHSLNQWVALYQ